MKSLFLDCNEQLAPVWAHVHRPDDPPIDVNRTAFKSEDLPHLLAGYDICIDDHSYLPTEFMAKCPPLRHVVFMGTGAASYMNIAELAALNIKVHTFGGYGDTAVAEHTIALMFAAARDLARMDREVRSGVWIPREGMQLLDKTLAVIGLGGIGREVARIAAGLGMKVLAWNRTPRTDAPCPLVDADDRNVEHQCLSCQRVIEVENDLVVENFVHADRALLAVGAAGNQQGADLARIFGHTLDLDLLVARRVDLTVTFGRSQTHVLGVADAQAGQLQLERR